MNIMNQKFAIITPCYNSSLYLNEMIDSVLNQSYENFILYLIDDGSTDSTATIIHEYALKDSRIVVHHQANSGVSVARNWALDRLEIDKVDRVVFCDSDDILSHNSLSTILQFEEDIVIYGVNSFTRTSSEITCLKDVKRFNREQLASIYFGGDRYLNNSILPFIGNKSFSTNILRDIRFREDFQLGEDILFIYEAIKKTRTSVVIPNVLYNYRLRKYSLSHSDNRDLRQVLDRYKFFYREFIKEGLNELAKFQNNKFVDRLWRFVNKNTHEFPLEYAKNLLDEYPYDIEFYGLSYKNFKKLFKMKFLKKFVIFKIKSKLPRSKTPNVSNSDWF